MYVAVTRTCIYVCIANKRVNSKLTYMTSEESAERAWLQFTAVIVDNHFLKQPSQECSTFYAPPFFSETQLFAYKY